MASGDRLAQRLERGSSDIVDRDELIASWRRTAILTTWSLCISAPFWTSYYSWVVRAIPNRPLAWIAITAVTAAPFNAAFLSFGSSANHFFEHSAPFSKEGRAAWAEKVFGKLDDRLVPTLIASTKVWPIVNWVMFKYIPLDYRQLFSSAFALGWNIYLSLAHGGKGIATDQAPLVAPPTVLTGAQPQDVSIAIAGAVTAPRIDR